MDQDEAGMKLMQNLNNNLTVPVLSMEFPDGVKDIGDMKDEQILSSYKQIKSLDLALSI
jgi:hypothetical protein